MVRNAGADRPRRYRIRKAGATEPSGMAWWRIYPAGHPQDRYSAGSGRAVADREVGDTIGPCRGTCPKNCKTAQGPRAPGARPRINKAVNKAREASTRAVPQAHSILTPEDCLKHSAELV